MSWLLGGWGFLEGGFGWFHADGDGKLAGEQGMPGVEKWRGEGGACGAWDRRGENFHVFHAHLNIHVYIATWFLKRSFLFSVQS